MICKKWKFLAVILFIASTNTQACQFEHIQGMSKRAIALLDYLSEVNQQETPSAAECAASIYRAISIGTFARDYPKKIEQLVQDVTEMQRQAAQTLEESGDAPAAQRFRRQEISLRRKAIDDIDKLGDTFKQILRTQRIRQIAYLTQAWEALDSGAELDEFLSRTESEYFQSQTISAWLKAISSCPSWKISYAGGVSDNRLTQDVCSSTCQPRARIAVATINAWQKTRKVDWNRNVRDKELNLRIQRALGHCSIRK